MVSAAPKAAYLNGSVEILVIPLIQPLHILLVDPQLVEDLNKLHSKQNSKMLASLAFHTRTNLIPASLPSAIKWSRSRS